MSESAATSSTAAGMPAGAGSGRVLASQELRAAIEREWISAGDFRIRPEAVHRQAADDGASGGDGERQRLRSGLLGLAEPSPQRAHRWGGM